MWWSLVLGGWWFEGCFQLAEWGLPLAWGVWWASPWWSLGLYFFSSSSPRSGRIFLSDFMHLALAFLPCVSNNKYKQIEKKKKKLELEARILTDYAQKSLHTLPIIGVRKLSPDSKSMEMLWKNDEMWVSLGSCLCQMEWVPEYHLLLQKWMGVGDKDTVISSTMKKLHIINISRMAQSAP